ncbi:NAD(P)-dependent oxidoreductase [Rhizobacter sp. Root1221]|uniref:NAD(P)-dependent oxidoreductase n=1 Tax=Rhizobacter sp. Root1221 TaxID=1736433 RepID=UPI0006FE52BE|nr:NAD(P)-dependent oxidoreductase [Rhizobacter sp. Root1221]KQV90430.1 3-beta hydroxysteroid dehydrogenase [Rhizobacter sp. Root1221]
MKIALIGGTGFVGTAVLEELLQRGHQVTALARDPAKYTAREGLKAVTADVLDAAQVADAVRGQDAVISAYNPGWTEPDIYNVFLKGTRAIVDGVKRAGTKRLLVVGGAGSLFVAPGVQGVDTPAFPAEWKQGALAARDALNEIRNETTLDWTFLSPAAILEPGPRTGTFRLGADQLLMNGDAPAKISVADLAVAIVDEIETPKHVQKRFTAAY